MAAASVPACPLLELPAELRNEIYRCTLVEAGGDIRIKKESFHEPALLYASKQVRSEALPVFYGKNTFDLFIVNFDSSVGVLWHKKARKLAKLHKVHVEARLSTACNPNWSNLMLWLQRYHAREVLSSLNTRVVGNRMGDDEKITLLAQMFDTAKEFRDMPWARVEKNLLGFRRLLKLQHKDWAKADEVATSS
ncbi:hypothetical protein LTR36_005019 [Oleoguttula mirabilis]|uniref:Uncharacterized protein n=1 Tax=Oleoguttula mirabilis TaxID=1507867 RepID=A0AAV9JX73_9PEZI|nr:hypothetical protein LTR36_005019 [Oleoguttula mirabilis]